MAGFRLTDVPGIGAATCEALEKAGIGGVQSLADAPIEKIEDVPGFGPARAAAVQRAARALLQPSVPVVRGTARAASAVAAERSEDDAVRQEVGVGRGKRKKKDKKGKAKKKDKKGKAKKKDKKGKAKKKDKKGKAKKKDKKKGKSKSRDKKKRG